MFYIKRISLITGNDKTRSDVEFANGLNIIYGESNTGKSLIVDCIDYMFGAKENRFDPKLQVKQLIMVLDVDGQNVTMYRDIDSTKIEVASTVSYIESDTYTIGNGSKAINNVWLRLLGIQDEIKIIQTLDGKQQRLTLRTFYHMLLIDEQRVQTQSSILAASVGFKKVPETNVLSALLYLATGNNFLPKEVGKDKRTKNERKDAVKKFVDRSISKLQERKISELQNFVQKTPAEWQQMIDHTLEEIGAAEGALEEATENSRKLADKLITIDNEVAECRVLRNRNNSLQTQYESDIRRLTFIAEGEIHGDSVPKLEYCPFCNGELPKEKTESCIDAAVAEVEKIEAQIKDLQSVQDSLVKEIKELAKEREQVVEQRKEIDFMIRAELRPQISQLKEHLADYTLSLNQYKCELPR